MPNKSCIFGCEIKKLRMDKSIVSEKDNAYWNDYYSNHDVPAIPSNFAESILKYVNKDKSLIELGCGNGRDSFFFARNHVHTVALDLSAAAIEHNSSFGHENVAFEIADFTALSKDQFSNVGNIYSRFTLHSIDHASYLRTLNWSADNLSSGGLLFLEARTINDPLCGQGDKVGEGEYVTTHYRRFVEIKDVMKELMERGFELEHSSENFTDSWYKDDHAAVYRIVARKK
jgi:tellurite methyltransferase